MTINLQKSTENLKITLEKKGLLAPPIVDVAFDLDVSGSYKGEHNDGSTNNLIARLVPWGIVLDPDKKLDCFTFSDGEKNAHYVGEITAENYGGYVRTNIIQKVPGWCGGTDYAPVLRKNLEHFGWEETGTDKKSSEGFLKNIFGKKQERRSATPQNTGTKRKSLILFNTDGANDDKADTERLLKRMEENDYVVYVIFLAYANRGADLSFIKRMADKFRNCGMHYIANLKKFVAMSDEDLNNALITDELVAWLKK